MLKKIGEWGGSRSLRLEREFKELGIEAGENVFVRIEDNKIIIEKIKEEFKVVNGVKFSVKE